MNDALPEGTEVSPGVYELAIVASPEEVARLNGGMRKRAAKIIDEVDARRRQWAYELAEIRGNNYAGE